MDISGNKMLHLKQDLAFLRQRLAECSEESAKHSQGDYGKRNLL